MLVQEEIDFTRIKDAISFIKDNFKKQPSLDEIAASVNLSPFHFQRMFQDWAGTSPKKFQQFISVEYAKSLLKEKQNTLFETTEATGLSSSSRLHDLFVSIEGMSPAEYRNGGEDLEIRYNFYPSPFGKILIASTTKGICYMVFQDEESTSALNEHFPAAKLIHESNALHKSALGIFRQDWTQQEKIKLHLKGTPFQLKVWKALLTIPLAELSTYGKIAAQIHEPKAARAVGTAIGNNPVAYLIPCHRVIQASGIFGGYMWGPDRKTAIIGWEAADAFNRNPDSYRDAK